MLPIFPIFIKTDIEWFGDANHTIRWVHPNKICPLNRPIRETNSKWHSIYFTQVTCFLNFNICNYLGTVIAGLVQWPRSVSVNNQVTLFLLSLLRMVMVPCIMTCNLAPSDRDLPVYFQSDLFFPVLLSIFSLSDGYINNMAMMFAPKAAKEEYQEITAGIMVATIATSMTIGSVFSNLVVKALWWLLLKFNE